MAISGGRLPEGCNKASSTTGHPKHRRRGLAAPHWSPAAKDRPSPPRRVSLTPADDGRSTAAPDGDRQPLGQRLGRGRSVIVDDKPNRAADRVIQGNRHAIAAADLGHQRLLAHLHTAAVDGRTSGSPGLLQGY